MVRRAQSVEKGVYWSTRSSIAVHVRTTVWHAEMVTRGAAQPEKLGSMSTSMLKEAARGPEAV